MLDLKGVMLFVIQQGLEDFGYGVVAVGSADSTNTDNPNTVTLKRSGAQDEDDRPLITIRRVSGPRTVQYYLGNHGQQRAGELNVPVIMVQDTVRIAVEATQNTGGQSLVDKLMVQIPVMLMQNWDVMIFPQEVGGFGLVNPTYRGGADEGRPFTEASGNMIYTNYIDVSATVYADAQNPMTPLGEISYVAFVPLEAGVST